MLVLLDTSLLLRLANASDRQYPRADRAIGELRRASARLHVTAQNLVEFRNSASRPAIANGLGLTPADADRHIVIFESLFTLIPETPDIYPAWKSLVASAGVVGKQVHDARLAAVCQVSGVTNILTFNVRHFTRFTGFIPAFTVLDPVSF
jgi:predicted nucleic acid-binding protein